MESSSSHEPSGAVSSKRNSELTLPDRENLKRPRATRMASSTRSASYSVSSHQSFDATTDPKVLVSELQRAHDELASMRSQRDDLLRKVSTLEALVDVPFEETTFESGGGEHRACAHSDDQC